MKVLRNISDFVNATAETMGLIFESTPVQLALSLGLAVHAVYLIMRHMSPHCEEPGCTVWGWDEVIECRIIQAVEKDGEWFDIVEYFCVEHCKKNGFCYSCGNFWEGNGAFDFSPIGLCPHCLDDVGGGDQ